MSLTIRQSHEIHHSVKKTLEKPTTQRGLGVHNEIRSVLYYLKHEHNFTRSQLWEVLNAKDGYGRNPAVPYEELDRLVEGLFEQGSKSPQYRTAVETTARIAAENRTNLILDTPRKEVPLFQIKTKRKALKPTPIQIAQWKANAETFIHGFGRDPLKPRFSITNQTRGSEQFIQAIHTLFDPTDNVSVVTSCNSEGKPIANDRSQSVDAWITACNAAAGNVYPYEQLGQRRGGVWWRVNPMQKEGSGKGGAMTDNDVASFRFLLVENDVLPLEIQLPLIDALMSRGQLTPRSIVDSAGKSYHSLVSCYACDADSYKRRAEDILYPLHEKFGFDLGNSNPSRMSRAAGFTRRIGSRNDGGGQQTLVYLAERSDS